MVIKKCYDTKNSIRVFGIASVDNNKEINTKCMIFNVFDRQTIFHKVRKKIQSFKFQF